MPKKTKKDELRKQKITNIALAIIAVFLIAFTISILLLYRITGTEPSTLITCVFGACTGELGFMALIKNSKHKYGIKDEEENCG